MRNTSGFIAHSKLDLNKVVKFHLDETDDVNDYLVYGKPIYIRQCAVTALQIWAGIDTSSLKAEKDFNLSPKIDRTINEKTCDAYSLVPSNYGSKKYHYLMRDVSTSTTTLTKSKSDTSITSQNTIWEEDKFSKTEKRRSTLQERKEPSLTRNVQNGRHERRISFTHPKLENEEVSFDSTETNTSEDLESRQSSSESKKFEELTRQLTSDPIYVHPVFHDDDSVIQKPVISNTLNNINIEDTPISSNQDILLPKDSNYWEGHTSSYQNIMDKLEMDIPVRKTRSQEKNEEYITKKMEEYRTINSNLKLISNSCLNYFAEGICKDIDKDDCKKSDKEKDDD